MAVARKRKAVKTGGASRNTSAAGRKPRSVRAQVSREEWETRVNLAACYRLMDVYEMTDLIANHISMRVPGEPDHFLINAYGMLYEEITASSLIKIDHEGNIIAKPDFGPGLDYGVNRAGFVIHSAIHMAKPDVNCVIHTHTWAGMAVSTMKCGLLPNTQTSMRFAEISYHDYEGVVIDTALRDRLVEDLGDNNAMILRNHGLLTVSTTIREAFEFMYYLDCACQIQVDAAAAGSLNIMGDNLAAKSGADMDRFAEREATFGDLEFAAMVRKMDKEKKDTSWRN